MNSIKYLTIISLFAVFFASCTFNKKKTSGENSQPETVPEVSAPETVLPTDTSNMKTYVNSVYRYHISYPVSMFVPQGESDSGDGQVFKTKDELGELRVYRDSRDILYEGAILKKSYREDLDAFDKDSLFNSQLTDDYYVIEGKIGNEYFHQKTFLRKDKLLVTAILTYKVEANDVYKPLVPAIFNSIR